MPFGTQALSLFPGPGWTQSACITFCAESQAVSVPIQKWVSCPVSPEPRTLSVAKRPVWPAGTFSLRCLVNGATRGAHCPCYSIIFEQDVRQRWGTKSAASTTAMRSSVINKTIWGKSDHWRKKINLLPGHPRFPEWLWKLQLHSYQHDRSRVQGVPPDPSRSVNRAYSVILYTDFPYSDDSYVFIIKTFDTV